LFPAFAGKRLFMVMNKCSDLNSALSNHSGRSFRVGRTDASG
jgi:hypothetical protein